MKENLLRKLELSQYIIPILTIIMYCLAILEVAVFYYINFNIDVLSILSLSEMVLISFPYLFFISLGVILTYMAIKMLLDNNKINKIVVIVFFIISYFYFKQSDNIFYRTVLKLYDLLFFTIPLTGVFYWIYNLKRIKSKKSVYSKLALISLNVSILFFAMLCSLIVFMLSILYTEQTYSKKICKIESEYYKNLKNTNKNYYFLFESDSFIALYDETIEETHLLQKEKIDLIKFTK